jgi:hypothetical protein
MNKKVEQNKKLIIYTKECLVNAKKRETRRRKSKKVQTKKI